MAQPPVALLVGLVVVALLAWLAIRTLVPALFGTLERDAQLKEFQAYRGRIAASMPTIQDQMGLQTAAVVAEMRKWMANEPLASPDILVGRGAQHVRAVFPANSDYESAEWVGRAAFVEIASEQESLRGDFPEMLRAAERRAAREVSIPGLRRISVIDQVYPECARRYANAGATRRSR